MRSFFMMCALATSCAAPEHLEARVEDARPLVTAGQRCQGEHCTCRTVDATGASVEGEDAETGIADGMKRFELRTGRNTDEVSITVEGRGTLKKATDQLDAACGTIELPPGQHRVHASFKTGPSEGGATPKLLIYEYGKNTHSWYSTFGITCGETGPCSDGDLHERMANLQARRGLFDKCGSTKIHDLRWENHKGADERVTSMDVDFILDIYKFDPRFPRGGACKGPSPE